MNPLDLTGEKLGDYRLQRKLAMGGMATIYVGIDEKLGRQAAVKVLSPDFAERDSSLPMRFEREAQAVGLLDHENIVTIFQYGQHESFYFLAMRYVEGIDLSTMMENYAEDKVLMPFDRALRILEQIASALDHAHSRGIIHRDIKPSNILIGVNDKAYLSDFGLVLRQSVDQTLGTAFGTPRYISPEQATDSQRVVPQSDIYSFAVIVYELVTGERLFKGNTPMEVALNHITETPLPPRAINPELPANAQQVILKSLEKDPRNRHATTMDFIADLKRTLLDKEGKPVKSTDAPPEPPRAGKTNMLTEPPVVSIPSPISEGSRPASKPSPSLSNRTRTLNQNNTLSLLPALPAGQNTALLGLFGGVALVAFLVIAVLLGSRTPVDNDNLPTLAPSPTDSPTAEVLAVVLTDEPTPTLTLTPTLALTSTVTNTPSPTPAPTETAVPIVVTEPVSNPIDLVYNADVIALRNLGQTEQPIRTLRFEGATANDTLNNDGERFGAMLSAGGCLVIKVSGPNIVVPASWACGSVREITFNNPSLFWRADAPTDTGFTVFLGNVQIGTCNTVGRAIGNLDEQTCALNQ